MLMFKSSSLHEDSNPDLSCASPRHFHQAICTSLFKGVTFYVQRLKKNVQKKKNISSKLHKLIF